MKSDPSEFVVEMTDVSKRYRRATVVEHLTLTIPRGTTLGLIGQNGAGKSTTIKMMMGMLAPSEGMVRVLGKQLPGEGPAIRQRVGYVPERCDLYPWMTVEEAVGFTRSFYPTWDQDYCMELIDLFQLDRRKKVRHLSKGMQVKVALLLAVSHRPELLVLDEPTSGLDPIVHDDFLDGVLQAVCQDKTTVLYSSHNLDDIRRVADSVCILCGGKIVVRRRIDELLASVKRVRAVLRDGHLPRWIPHGTVWQRVNRREWLLTVDDCTDDVAARIKSENPVEAVEVFNLNLGDLFRDFVLGRNGK